MKIDNEKKIALIVAVIMITACLLAFIFTREEEPEVTLDIKVYKHVKSDNEDESGKYVECQIDTSNLSSINAEFKKIMKLNDNYRVSNTQINGDYKIISGTDYIAFDDDDKPYVYRGDTTAIYSYSSNIYDNIVYYCDGAENASAITTTTEDSE